MESKISKYSWMEILKEKYNLDAKKIEKNQQSTDHNVYEIYCDTKKYIAKIYHNINHTKSMTNLHHKLAESKINVPKIIPSITKEDYVETPEKSYLVIYSFLEGKPISRSKETGKFDRNTISLIAKELRKIHKFTSNYNQFDLPEISFAESGNRKSLVHFDLTKNNIFIDVNHSIGIIDFDDAKYGESICDIAILIANLFFSKTYSVDLEGINKLIDEYYLENIELKNREIPFIKEYALKWIEYTLRESKLDSSIVESFKIKYKLIEGHL